MKKKTLLLMLALMFISTNALSQNWIQGQITGDVQEGISVELYKNSCGGDALVGTFTTNTAGYYGFGGLEDGDYNVIPFAPFGVIIAPEVVTVQIPQTELQSYDFTATLLPEQQAFTSYGNFIVPTGITQITVELWGAGGGGGGGADKGSIFCEGAQGGGGGGSGGYTTMSFSVTPGERYSVDVGQAGGGGLANGNGYFGQESSFGGPSGTLLAGGGLGGNAGNDCVASTPNGEGGLGGFGSMDGGRGQDGDDCYLQTGLALGGSGGSPVLGSSAGGRGGNGECTIGSPTNGNIGSDGLAIISWSY